MGVLKNVIIEEYQRTVNNLSLYEKRINELPKGSISIKRIHNKEYFYLKYRDGSKIKTKYIKFEDKDNFEKQIQERKRIEGIIRTLKGDIALFKKVMK